MEDLTIEKSIDDDEGIKKQVVKEKIKIMEEKHNDTVNLLRKEMENKFQEILLKIDVDRVMNRK